MISPDMYILPVSIVMASCQARTPQELLHVAAQLTDGMKFVASKKFVHMDLAARNVLVAPNGLVKVADFGLTHAYDEGCLYYKQLGVLKLSIRWLAIDSFDHKLFSEASDVWSWGVLLWELFSYGTQPYKGYKLPEVLRLVRSGLRLSQPKTCPDPIFALMTETWSIDRFSRPTFATLLEKVQAVQAANPGPSPRGLGELLNKDLAAKIRQSSVRIKKKGAAGASTPDGRDDSGLMGAVDSAPMMVAPGKLTTNDDGIKPPENGLF
jgi:serine/threonine protein kinase